MGKQAKKQPQSPAVTRTASEKSMMERIVELENKVELLDKKVESLENTVEPLKVKINQLTDQNAVLTCAISNLKTQAEENQQYSRRNCLVLEGIALSNNETIPALEGKVVAALTKELGIEKTEIDANFDKTHRIGPIRDNQQRTIVRFKKHSLVEKIYNKRKVSEKISVKPSLTKYRLNTLNDVRNRFERSEFVEFFYADVHGNMKVRFKKQLNGRFVHNFYSENELSELIFEIENSYCYE